jgi:hypothetical protein
MKGRKIEHEYDGDTRSMMRREQVVISRLRMGYTRATHGPWINEITDPHWPFCDTGLTVDHVLWDYTETEQTKREMMMTPAIWTRGAEGMKKIIEYTRKIGFYDGIWKIEEIRRHKNPSCKYYPEKQPHPKPNIS